jgi:ADP-ribose pyrophosphatase
VEAWRKRGEKVVYNRYRRVLSRTFELPDGDVTDYEVFDLLDCAAVLALTPSDEVVLVEEFRPGPEAVLLELPGGVIEPGREASDAAHAELLEETGYVGDLIQIGTLLMDGYATNVKHVFAATGCRRVAESEKPQLAAPILMPLDAFREHLRRGKLTDADAAYLALDRLGLL